MLACILLAFSLGMVSVEGSAKYPESAGNGWTGTCMTGMAQSPIDLDPNMEATVHSPITYRNYFNGHFNKHHKGKLVAEDCSVDWFLNAKDTSKLMGGKKWKYHCPSIRDGPFAGGADFTHSHAFYLYTLHFHWGTVGDDTKGSEHTVGNMSFPLEMHMVHVEDQFIAADGTVDLTAAKADPWGIAVLSILFKVDNNKPQNMEPLEKVDDKIWEFHYHHGGHPSKRSAEETEEDEEDAELEHYHNLNMRSLSYGFSKIMEAKKEKRDMVEDEAKLKLNVGAFIRKAIRNGKDKTMSTYWTYKGSLTTPDCNEAVTWVVFERALTIAQVQANAFASLCPDTYRMTKPLNGRTVQYLIHKPAKH